MSAVDIIQKIKQLEDKAQTAENKAKFEKIERDKEKLRANQLEAENAKLKAENAQLKIELDVLRQKVDNTQQKQGIPQRQSKIDIFEQVLSPGFEGPKTSGIVSPPKTPIITSPPKTPKGQQRPKSAGLNPNFTMDQLKQKLENIQPKPKGATPKMAMLPTNPNQIIPSAIMPNKKDCHQEGFKIIHTSQNSNICVVACNPVISSGIVRFEGFFDNTSNFCMIGIADASVTFEPNLHPGEYKGKTLTYASSNGFLQHLSFPGLMGNAEFANREKIGCEVVMDQKPRRVHFFIEGTEQKNAVVEIPPAIRFLVCIYNPNSSFTLLKFERLQQCSAKGVNGAKAMEWGKLWDNA